MRRLTVFHDGDGIWVQWFVHPLRYLATTTETDGKYCLSIGSVERGQGASPHSHDFDEGFYVLSGAVEFTAGTQKILLQAGDFINISAHTVHYPRGASEETAKMLVIAAPCAFDQFQMRVGQRLAGPDAKGTKSESEMHATANSCAAEYGINMFPTQEAMLAAPSVQVTRQGSGDAVDVVGDRYRFLAEGKHTGGAYAIWHATIQAGGGPPLHIHRREEEGFLVLKGELRFEADGQTTIGKPGTFVNLPIGTRHRFYNASSEEAEALIMVAPGGLEGMFHYTGSRVSDLHSPIAPPSPADIERLLSVANQYGIELEA